MCRRVQFEASVVAREFSIEGWETNAAQISNVLPVILYDNLWLSSRFA